jgi:hypothetical protein
MNLPIQAPPVMRGRNRSSQLLAADAVSQGIAQSQAATDWCQLCTLAPPPWNLVCKAFCPGLIGGH